MYFGRPASRLPTNCDVVVAVATNLVVISSPPHHLPPLMRPVPVSNSCSNPFADDTFLVKICSSSLWQTDNLGTLFYVSESVIKSCRNSNSPINANRANDIFYAKRNAAPKRNEIKILRKQKKKSKLIFINKNIESVGIVNRNSQ